MKPNRSRRKLHLDSLAPENKTLMAYSLRAGEPAKPYRFHELGTILMDAHPCNIENFPRINSTRANQERATMDFVIGVGSSKR
jgi:hypothetical protein